MDRSQDGDLRSEELVDDPTALVDSILKVGPARYSREEVAKKAGVTLDFAQKFWRAVGFPQVGEGVLMFTDEDVQAIRGVYLALEEGLTDEQVALEIARATGQSASRLADAQVGALQETVPRPPVTEEGVDTRAATELMGYAQKVLPVLERSLVYLWRRHLAAATKRVILSPSVDEPTRAVGFADMADFSTLSQQMDQDELAALVSRFEALSFDTVSEFGGRVVKLIGDEVMFVTDDVIAAASIALSLVERAERDELLPSLKAGLAYGPVVDLEGDVFGATVNLASRSTGFARPGTVVVSEGFVDNLPDRESLELSRIRRPVHLKGLGRAKLYALKGFADREAAEE
ncbi:MAG: adenylate/guanylate cyclase domain-containing protein [Actinomycetota bacterium]|nr:adenylate/guanylate cyclase domain-containing protein [Actinomycetota bacterium]